MDISYYVCVCVCLCVFNHSYLAMSAESVGGRGGVRLSGPNSTTLSVRNRKDSRPAQSPIPLNRHSHPPLAGKHTQTDTHTHSGERQSEEIPVIWCTREQDWKVALFQIHDCILSSIPQVALPLSSSLCSPPAPYNACCHTQLYFCYSDPF